MEFLEFGGGLGDIFNAVFTTDRYARLDRLVEGDSVTVLVASHNPGSKELFEYHRNRAHFTLRDLGYWTPSEDREKRKHHGIPRPRKECGVPPNNLTFYPAPADLPILNQLSEEERYLILGSAAGTEPSRDLPSWIRDDILRLARSRGIKVVVVGRTYRLFDRAEHRFPKATNIINLIDRLSVPGTVLAAQRALGVACCHSSICSLSWHLNKPTFVAYPDYVKTRHFTTPDKYSFGRDRPNTTHLDFSEYSSELFAAFLKKINAGHGRLWIS